MSILQSAYRISGRRFPHQSLPLPGMRAFRPKPHSRPWLPADAKREKEEKKVMARRKLSLEEQLRGVRAALKSRRTPPQLKAGLERREKVLERTLGKSSVTTNKHRSFFDDFSAK
jgi:hypothetical protein